MKKKLFEGLTGTLGEATVKELTDTFNEALEDGIKLKTAERIKQLEEKSEEFVQKKVSSLMEAKERELINEYETKYKEFGDYIIGNLDTFLESAVVDTISESVIEDVARVQMYAPIVKDIMESFGKHYAPIAPKDADSALADALKESAELKKMIDKTMKENKKLVEMSERAAVRVLFTEKTQGLVKSAKVKIWEMVKDFDFDTVERKIDGLVSLVEEFSDVPDDNSVGGVGGVSDDIDLSGMGDDGTEDDIEDEPTIALTLSKAEFDSMVAIEVAEDEDAPVGKKIADMISSYVKESEEGEEVDEDFVNFEIPESVGREIKSMFTTEDGEIDEEAFGDIGEEVKSAVIEFIGNVPDEDDGMGDGEGDEGDEGDIGDDTGTEDVSPVTEWHKKWASR